MLTRILFLWVFSLFSATVISKDNPAQGFANLRPPQVKSPTVFVQKQIQRYTEREAILAAMLERADDLLSQFSFAKSLKIAIQEAPKEKYLSVQILGPNHPNPDLSDLDPDYSKIGPTDVFITDLNLIRIDSGLLISSNIFAVDEITASALTLPTVAALELTGDVVTVFDHPNSNSEGCCIREEGKNDNKQCVEYASIPKQIVHRSVDLSRYLNDKIKFNLKGAISSAGHKNLGFKFSKPGKHIIEVETLLGMKPSKVVQCVSGKDKENVIAWDFEKEVIKNVEIEAIKIAELGINGLDFDISNNNIIKPGARTKRNFFRVAQPQLGIGRTAAGSEATQSNGLTFAAYPMAILEKNEGELETRSVPSLKKEKVAGPFSLDKNNSIELLKDFLPGRSDFTWSLIDGTKIKTHRFTANEVRIEIDERIGMGKILAETKYEAKVIVEGPVNLAKYEINWAGNHVNWQSTQVGFKANKEGLNIALNTFTVPAGKFPRLEITFNSPEGEIALFEVAPLQAEAAESPVVAVDLMATQGHLGEPKFLSEPILDFFFPNNLGTDAMQAVFHLIAKRANGQNFDFLKSENNKFIDTKETSKALRKQINKLLPTDDKKGIFSSGLALTAKGNAVSFIAQSSGSAKILARMGGADVDPKNLLGTPDGKFVSSEAITVTSNAVRLIRNKSGFILRVRGPADMNAYQASWMRRGFTSSKDTKFEKTAEGAEAIIKTAEKLDFVSIMKSGEEYARTLGIAAQVDARIRLVLDSARAAIKQVPLVNNGSLESLTACRQSISFGLQALNADSKGQSADQICRDQRELDKVKIKELRAQQKASNKILKNLEKQGKQLISLAESVNVGAFLEGLPDPILGRIQCRWALKSKANGMQIKASITAVKRANAGQGSCFNVVSGVREGFDPNARIKVTLLLDDSPSAVPLVKDEFEQFFKQEGKLR